METEIFTVCDFAQDNSGKLTIVGTFDRINPPSLPYVHPSFSIAVRLRFSEKELGAHKFQLKINAPEGKQEMPMIEGDINVTKNPGADYTAINFAVNLNQIKFEKTGKYTIELLMDGEWISGLTLTVANR